MLRGLDNDERDISGRHLLRQLHRRTNIAVPAAIALILILLLAACGTTSTGQHGATSPTATSNGTTATVQVYFAKHPDTDNKPTAVFPVSRTPAAPVTSVQDRATFALEQMLKGPTQAERNQGYYSPFDGQLALQSVCPGPFRDFDLTFDHRGPMVESGAATIQFCRRVDISGDLDGPRMSAMVMSTLMQFVPVKQVVILNYMGACFDDMQGMNACLNGSQGQQGQQTGYPVKVYFSKHPASDDDFAAVFAVARTAPDLGVATYAVNQLIAGPTAAEKQVGYFTELTAAINKNDASSCGGADVTITLNMHGSTLEAGTATLQFCRTLSLPGEGADARIGMQLKATLTQFPTIKKAVILTKQGNCFGHPSGQNLCLKGS